MVNKFKYILFVIMLLISTKVYAYTFDNTLKVYDYAQVLTKDQIDNLKGQVKEYVDKYNVDMVITTVKYYTEPSLEGYAKEFYTRNNFGINDKKNGIILTYDVRNNDSKVMVFGDATNLYNENEINNLINIVNKEKKDYNKLKKFIKYSDEYALSNIEYTNIYNNKFFDINWIFVLLPSLIIPTIIVASILIRINMKKTSNKENYINVDNVVINKRQDNLVTTNTKKIKRKNVKIYEVVR